MAGNDPQRAAALRGRAARPDYRDALRALPMPSVLCTGTDGAWSTAESPSRLVECLRGAVGLPPRRLGATRMMRRRRHRRSGPGIVTHVTDTVGVRELRQNLSKYLDRVKDGEALVVTERGRRVARLIPAGAASEPYAHLAERFGSTIPVQRLEDIAAQLPRRSSPAGTTDARLAEGRSERSA